MNKEQARRRAAQRLEWAALARKRANELHKQMISEGFDYSEPIKHDHHSARSHTRKFERRDRNMQRLAELMDKAEMHEAKARNLLTYASRNKGDAEKARLEKQARIDAWIRVGCVVNTVLYGKGVVKKVNRRTVVLESGAIIKKHLIKRHE